MTKIVDARARGTSIDAEVDETVLVRLDETPTTGYRWAIEHVDDQVLQAEGSEFQLPAGAAVGGAGQRTYVFKARNPGSGGIRLKLWREWEGAGSVLDQFEISVRVKRRG